MDMQLTPPAWRWKIPQAAPQYIAHGPARHMGSAVECFEVWGFVTNDPAKTIGEALGL
jgi:hypothetical protein